MKKLLFLLTLGFIGCNSNPTYTIPGYEHGVVICFKDGAFVTVNHGHYQDKEVPELMALLSNCK